MDEKLTLLIKLVSKDVFYWISFSVGISSLGVSIYTLFQVLFIKRKIIQKKAIHYYVSKLQNLERNITIDKKPSDILKRIGTITELLSKYLKERENTILQDIISKLPKSVDSDSDWENIEMVIHSIINEFEGVEY